MAHEFNYYEDFDPYKCWELGCDQVEEEVCRDENGEIYDCQLVCGASIADAEECPLKRYIESGMKD